MKKIIRKIVKGDTLKRRSLKSRVDECLGTTDLELHMVAKSNQCSEFDRFDLYQPSQRIDSVIEDILRPQFSR